MKTIKNNIQNEIIIKNSKFICYLYKIKDINEINSILHNIKEEHINATHHCYAYILNNTQKSSDDGEPTGTAGIPILKVLEKNNLSNILAIVVRYFGGIKKTFFSLYSNQYTFYPPKNHVFDYYKSTKRDFQAILSFLHLFVDFLKFLHYKCS